MYNETFVCLYQKKARKATRGHTREIYQGLATLGKHYPQAELERQLWEELRVIKSEEKRRPAFCRIYKRYVRQALQDLRQEATDE